MVALECTVSISDDGYARKVLLEPMNRLLSTRALEMAFVNVAPPLTVKSTVPKEPDNKVFVPRWPPLSTMSCWFTNPPGKYPYIKPLPRPRNWRLRRQPPGWCRRIGCSCIEGKCCHRRHRHRGYWLRRRLLKCFPSR